ncbi:MAG TPA: hypothetical protein V6D14_09780 [Coleofasciculaceae cyanobacterium]|jgi:hypothetical protein
MGRLFYVAYVLLITNCQLPISFKPPQARFVGAQCRLQDEAEQARSESEEWFRAIAGLLKQQKII